MPTDLPQRGSPDQREAARAIAEELKPLIQEAKAACLDMLTYLLGMARIEAETVVEKTQGQGR